MYYKIIRDPIYSEIRLNPLEVLIIDTPLFQRLRNITQLVGVSWVFPSSTHNRFSHSLGVLHIASLYSSHLFKHNKFKQVVIRLAALLHDIAHGPFSHQFDDTVYKKLGIHKGHDEFRKTVILNHLPIFIKKSLRDNLQLAYHLAEFINENILKNQNILKFNEEVFENVEEIILDILKEVVKVYENKGSVENNIIQGPLGADRLDFIRRDSYFTGATGFPKGSFDRIIYNSKIINNFLCYHVKTFDEVFSVLTGRFLMYKNVYFHKTARSIDILIQDILNNTIEVFKKMNLDYKEILENPYKFYLLTDEFIINTIINLYNNMQNSSAKKIKLNEKIKNKIEKAYNLIQNLRNRKIYKLVYEKYIYKSKLSLNCIKEKFIQILKNKISELINLNKQELEILVESLKFDISEEIKIFDPLDLEKHNIFLYNNYGEIIKITDFVKNNPIYDIKSKNIRIFRIYITHQIDNSIKDLIIKIIKENKIDKILS